MRKRAPRSIEVPSAARIENDVGNWRRMLDRIIWVLRKGGVSSQDIESCVRQSVRRHATTRGIKPPSQEQIDYSRVLSHWQEDTTYLDKQMQARKLPLNGPAPSFESLVRAALPQADPSDVLKVLRRYRLVTLNSAGVVRMLATAFIPRGPNRSESLTIALNSLELLTSTCYRNLRSRRESDNIGRLQRYVYTEYFAPQFLSDYDAFTRKTARAYIEAHNSWLRRHEVRSTRRRRRPRRAGVGVYGFVDL